MGIKYEDSVVVYNRYLDKENNEKEQYFGTRFDNVRVEFTQEMNQSKSGSEDISVCLLKILNDDNLPKQYIDPKTWKKFSVDEKSKNFTLSVDGDFFVIVKKKSLFLDVEAPVGMQESSDSTYGGNFFEYMKENYGYVYSMNSFNSFELITRFEVGGR